MSVVEGGPGSAGLIARVQNILLKPQEEWVKIDSEPATIQGLFTGYVLILAAIPAVAQLISGLLFVHMIPVALVSAVVTYALAVGGTFVFGLIVEALAPTFDAQKDRVQAMKLVVYASTASWVAGILGIIPGINVLGAIIGGVYSLYLLFIGTPILMKSPAEKSTGYTIAAIVCSVVMNLIVGSIAAAVIGAVTIATVGSAIATSGALIH